MGNVRRYTRRYTRRLGEEGWEGLIGSASESKKKEKKCKRESRPWGVRPVRLTKDKGRRVRMGE